MITIEVRWTRAARANPAIMDGLRRPMVLGEALARRIAARVAEGGDTATPARRYSEEVRANKQMRGLARAYDRAEAAHNAAAQRGDAARAAHFRKRMRQVENAEQSVGETLRPYVISEDYARLLGLTETRFRSSAAFHEAAGTKPGTFRVSGGMWAGLGVRNVGANTAIIDFAGSSIGGQRQSATTKTGRVRRRAVLTRNQVKAGTVFRASGVNPIQPKDEENEAMGAAVARWSQQMIGRVLGASIGEFYTTADRQLLADILRHYDGTG